MPSHIEVSCRPSSLFLAHDGKLSPVTAVDGAPFPLGAAVACDLRQTSLDGLADASRAHSRSPWYPMAVVLPDGASATILEPIRPDWGRLATLAIRSEDMLPTYGAVSQAVAQRGPPDRNAVTRYIRSRAGERLARAVAMALEGSDAWSAGLRRCLGRLDMPSPQHWANLFRLATHLASSTHPRGRTLEQIALESNCAPRTLSGWCAKYLRKPWPEARRRLGWEWAIEVFLREHGCTEVSPLPPLPEGEGPGVRG